MTYAEPNRKHFFFYTRASGKMREAYYKMLLPIAIKKKTILDLFETGITNNSLKRPVYKEPSSSKVVAEKFRIKNGCAIPQSQEEDCRITSLIEKACAAAALVPQNEINELETQT